jgi:hypothetical protein
MSGGSFDYEYSRVEQIYSGRMEDPELNEMIVDLSKLLKELEWWKSDDTSEEDYRKEVAKFKDKWFGKRDENLRILITNELMTVKEIIEKL